MASTSSKAAAARRTVDSLARVVVAVSPCGHGMSVSGPWPGHDYAEVLVRSMKADPDFDGWLVRSIPLALPGGDYLAGDRLRPVFDTIYREGALVTLPA